MHELSIVASVVDSVTESLDKYPDARVQEVRLRVGVLAGVVVDSLEFCWGIATEGTVLEGSRLVIKTVPIVMHCEPCAADVELEGVQSFRCLAPSIRLGIASSGSIYWPFWEIERLGVVVCCVS